MAEFTSRLEHYREIIPDFSAFQESLQRPLPVHIRVNSLKIEPGSLIEKLSDKGILLERVSDRYDTLFLAPHLELPGNLLEYYLGYIHPQALTSCLVPVALSAKQDAFVLDMCASPGGKTAQIAQMMNNTGLIIANELSAKRHIPLAGTLARLGVLNSAITAYQAQQFPLKERFDFVLADVPCTGEGTRRGPLYRHTERQTGRNLSDLQKGIILRGFDLMREGGEMVYSTCTYNPEENESIVDYLLQERDAELLPVTMDFPYEPGLLEWKKEKYDERLQRAARFYPHRVDSVGFFMARIGRRNG